MNEQNGLNRETKFALMSALAAGIVSIFLIVLFFDMLNWLFIPSVVIMVFISAYFAFRRQTRNNRVLTKKRIIRIAFEVGTVTHFYTFALYLPLYYFIKTSQEINLDIIGSYLGLTLMGGLSSLVMFIWIAVPIYIGVGHIQQSMEKNMPVNQNSYNESLLDDVLTSPD